MLNCPRRGNQPSLKSWDSSIEVMNVRASKISDSTIPALIAIDRADAASSTAFTRPSLRRRCRVPWRRLDHRASSWSCGDLQSTRVKREPAGPSELVRPVPWRRELLLAGVPGGPRLGQLVGRQVHVRDRLEHGRDGAFSQVEVDKAGHCRVLRGLGLVDVDVEGPRERVRAVGDGLGGRGDAGAVRVLRDLDLG